MRWGVALAHYGHRQLDPYPISLRAEVHNDLLDRAGGGEPQRYVLHHGVALAQPLHRPVDQGAQPPCTLDVSEAGIVQDGLPGGQGAHERFGFFGHDPLVVGFVASLALAASCGRGAWASGVVKTSGIQGIGTSSLRVHGLPTTPQSLRYSPNLVEGVFTEVRIRHGE